MSGMASPREAMAVNASQTSIPEGVHASIAAAAQSGLVNKAFEGTSFFGAIATLFAILVAYDQSE